MSVQTDIKLIDNASKVIAGIDQKVNKLADNIDDVNSKKLIDDKSINDTRSAIDKLGISINGFHKKAFTGFSNVLSKFSQFSIALYGIQSIVGFATRGITAMAGYSDTLSETTARFNLMQDGLYTTEALWDMVYQSSTRSRGSAVDTANAVAKLGITAKGLFKNNRELVQFSENLTKSFKIAGTDTQGINSAMLQLSQSLSSGVLRGEELNSIFENAPLLIQNIADYMGVPIGQIRDLASEGKITADIVKNAILGATDEINEKFEQLPMTFDELGTQFSNIWYNNMMLVKDDLEKIPQSLANNLLPIWDAFTYTIFTDLDGVYKEQQKGATETASHYERMVDVILDKTGYLLSTSEALKVDMLASFELIESGFKKTGNAIINTAEFIGGALVYAVGCFANLIMALIQKVSLGLINLEDEIDWIENKLSSVKSAAFTYDNRLNDKYYGVTSNLADIIVKDATEKVYSDRQKIINNQFKSINNSYFENKGGLYPQDTSNKYGTTLKYENTLPTDLFNNVGSIARDVADISKGINNLNDLNKSIMEINEATYHNNVANQFNGTIQIIANGVDEEGQKSIGKQTEEAVRRVIFNDYQNMQAMGVYA